MVRGSPCMCMRQTSAPLAATTPAISASPRSAVTSLTIVAPAASARRATSAFAVSIEMTTAERARTPSITGSTRSSSTSSDTPSEPGRVDSPPMSTIAAPSSTWRSASSMASVRIEEAAAVGEGVRRDVDDAHQHRAGQARFERGGHAAHRTARRPSPATCGRGRGGDRQLMRKATFTLLVSPPLPVSTMRAV